MNRKFTQYIFALVFVIAIMGYFFYSFKNQPKNTLTSSSTPSPAIVESAPDVQIKNDPNLKIYTSSNLGISFKYLAKIGNQEFSVTEVKNKICLSYEKNDAKCQSGQSVQVFNKDTNETLTAAIKRMFLSGKDANRCLVTIIKNENDPASWVKAEITFPNRSGDYGMKEALEDASYCSSEYSRSSGVSYFLEDQNHKDKFVFFRIGQDNYPSENGKNWQDTISFE
jgi:hypothetical protein